MESPPTDYFEILGIERRLALDVDDIQRRFYDRTRLWHPDRHARGTSEQRLFAELATATLNDAWRVLRDPVTRAEYLLKAEGFDIGEQRSRDVPPELLEEVFDLNMALEEAKMGDSDAKRQVATALIKFDQLLAASDRERDLLFQQYDREPATESLTKLRSLLNRRKYVQNLVRDARASLG